MHITVDAITTVTYTASVQPVAGQSAAVQPEVSAAGMPGHAFEAEASRRGSGQQAAASEHGNAGPTDHAAGASAAASGTASLRPAQRLSAASKPKSVAADTVEQVEQVNQALKAALSPQRLWHQKLQRTLPGQQQQLCSRQRLQKIMGSPVR